MTALAPVEHPSSENHREHKRLVELIANVPGVVWEEMFDGSTRYVNDYIEVMLGYSAAEYLAGFTSITELIHEDDLAGFEQRTVTMMVEGGGTHRFRLRRRDGRIIWCESHCSLMYGDDGQTVIGMRGVSMDVTERVAHEEALRRSEERFRNLADASPVMIWTTTSKGEADFHNKRVTEFSGDPDLIGEKWMSIVHPDDVARVTEIMAGAHQRGEWTPFEMRVRRYDGEYRELFCSASAREQDGAFDGFVGMCVDLTEPRRMERRLQENKRLAGLGRLAATIAHEINNVLMAIQPFAEVIRRTRSQEVLERASDRIGSAVKRGGRITHQILRYAHASEPAIRPIDVAVFFDAEADSLKALLGNRVDLRVHVGANLRVLADPHHLQQIFANFATNAADAMNGSGTLTIHARSEKQWPGLDARPDGFVHFIAEDSGPGVPADLATRVFEPLFTTKPYGTGLGLAIVHDVVRRHGGAVCVDGSSFHVVLPATQAETQVGSNAPARTWPESVRRVVLIEDEEAVADALTMTLELEGVEVVGARTGSEAKGVVEAFEPDLVILDIGLPDISGTEVFAELRHLHPRLPILFATGHAGDLEGQLGTLTGPVGSLLKPFSLASLTAAVHALDVR